MRRVIGDRCLNRVTASAARATSASPPTPQKTRSPIATRSIGVRLAFGDPLRRRGNRLRHAILARQIVRAAEWQDAERGVGAGQSLRDGVDRSVAARRRPRQLSPPPPRRERAGSRRAHREARRAPSHNDETSSASAAGASSRAPASRARGLARMRARSVILCLDGVAFARASREGRERAVVRATSYDRARSAQMRNPATSARRLSRGFIRWQDSID